MCAKQLQNHVTKYWRDSEQVRLTTKLNDLKKSHDEFLDAFHEELRETLKKESFQTETGRVETSAEEITSALQRKRERTKRGGKRLSLAFSSSLRSVAAPTKTADGHLPLQHPVHSASQRSQGPNKRQVPRLGDHDKLQLR